MPQYSDNEIRSRLEFSGKMFHQIESYVTDFLNYVPFDFSHLEVYSLRLVSIILETGPEVLSCLELAVARLGLGLQALFDDNSQKDLEALWLRERELKERKQSLSFRDYYQYLEQNLSLKLSDAKIILRDYKAYTAPFEKTTPDWWDSYNLLKHDKYSNLKKATLRNALNASSALFLLANLAIMTAFAKPLDSKLFLSIGSPSEIDDQWTKV